MTTKISITLDDEVVSFIDSQGTMVRTKLSSNSSVLIKV